MFKETGPENEGREDTAATLQRWQPQLCQIFLKVVKENLVPCPNNSCKGSNTQFYSAHGLEQHWSRFHKAPGCNFSHDSCNGTKSVKKIAF